MIWRIESIEYAHVHHGAISHRLSMRTLVQWLSPSGYLPVVILWMLWSQNQIDQHEQATSDSKSEAAISPTYAAYFILLLQALA